MEKICRRLALDPTPKKVFNRMNEKSCYICGKKKLSKDEVGITRKLIDKNTKYFYCYNCLAEYLEVDIDFLLIKVKEFKEEGCTLFK